MNTNFEDVVMKVIQNSQDPTPKDTFYTSYLLNQQGILTQFARRSNPTIDFSDKSTSTKSIWAAGSIYAMAQLVYQQENYDKSLELQSLLHNSDPSVTAQIVQALVPFIIPLSLSKHGNFVVQAAVMHASPTQYICIFDALVGSFPQLTDDAWGCWVVYTILEKASHKQRQLVKGELLESGEQRNSHSSKVWRLFDRLESVPVKAARLGNL